MSFNIKRIKRIGTGIVGTIVLLAGIALIVLPGPATLVIPAGLTILATEFVWARNLLVKVKETFKFSNKKQSEF